MEMNQSSHMLKAQRLAKTQVNEYKVEVTSMNLIIMFHCKFYQSIITIVHKQTVNLLVTDY
eukprot:m.349709 g.349709  ORF g.349709 m.349709 type:complete len:61 (-) comp43614_c0_seq1:28-210(-)